ncbi:MAG TPA: glutamate formimidoyltransferase [Moorella mulderi]|nr:glutamate formimidoyltransferase [Moorella mulderi]
MAQYIHSAPNFSEGRRLEVVEAVVAPLKGIPGVKLITYHPDPDFNRTVVELVGKPDPLKEALLAMAGKAYELIDLNQHQGAHPRIGALDVVSLAPLRNITLEEVKQLARRIGEEIYQRYKVPVYFSGELARTPERKNFDYIRRGQFEGLKEAVLPPERAPDLGGPTLHPTAGATIVTADPIALVAVNVILDSDDLDLAKRIAKAVRGPSGGFSTVRAIGLRFTQRQKVAVSMDMFDVERTPIYRVYELIRLEAERRGVKVLGTQIVGTLRQEALIKVAEFYLGLEDFNRDQILENHLIDLESPE